MALGPTLPEPRLTLANDGRILCQGHNFRMHRDAKGWRVAGELKLNERLDYLSGNLVKHKPMIFGCRASDIEPAT